MRFAAECFVRRLGHASDGRYEIKMDISPILSQSHHLRGLGDGFQQIVLTPIIFAHNLSE